MSGQESSIRAKAIAGRRLNVPIFCVAGLIGCVLVAFVIHVTLFKQFVIDVRVSEDQSTLVVRSAHQDWDGYSEQLTAWNINTGQHASHPIDHLEFSLYRLSLPSLSDDGTRLLISSSAGPGQVLDVFTGDCSPLPGKLSVFLKNRWLGGVHWIENDSKLLMWSHGTQSFCTYELSTGNQTVVDGTSGASNARWLSDRIVFNRGHFYRREGHRLKRISANEQSSGIAIACSPDDRLVFWQAIGSIFPGNVRKIEDGSEHSAVPLMVTNIEIQTPVFASNTELAQIDNGQAKLVSVDTMSLTHCIDFDTDDVAHAEYLRDRKQYLRVSDSGIVTVHDWNGDMKTIGQTFLSERIMQWLSVLAVLVWWIGWTKLVPPHRPGVANWIPILGFTLAVAAIVIGRAKIQFDAVFGLLTLGLTPPGNALPEYSSLLGAIAALSAVLLTRWCLGKDRWSLAIGWSVLFVAALWGFMLWAMNDQFSDQELSQFQFNVAVALIVFGQIVILALVHALRFRFWHSSDAVVSERRSRQVRLSDLFLWTVGFAAMFLIGSSVHRKAMSGNELAILAVNGLIISAPLATFAVLMLQINWWQKLTLLVTCCVPIVAATLIAPQSSWMYSSISVTTVVLTGQVVFIAAAWSLRRAGYRLIRIGRVGKTAV